MSETTPITGTRAAAQSGFSMIELLVVIAIIGMLAGMVALNVVGQGDKAKQQAAYTQLKLFEDALEVYRLDNGNYPSAEVGLRGLVEGKYIKERKIPKDPWNNEYKYVRPGPQGYPFDIVSYGADGVEGGTDLDADITLSQGIGGKDDDI